MTIDNLPKAKWVTAGNQVILKTDFTDIEQAILDSIGYVSPPPMSWATNATIKVLATAGSPARLLLSGFPDILHPGQFANPTASDGTYRANTVDETMDISNALCRWGTEQASTWYAVMAVKDNSTGFDLKVMPYMRVKADATNKITTRNNAHGGDLNYGFGDDDLVDSYVYIISGSKKGYSAKITSNDATGGYTNIDYDGDALNLTAGDWFIVLPNVDYRWLGDVFNSSGSHLLNFTQDGHVFRWTANQTLLVTVAGTYEDFKMAPPMATMALMRAVGTGMPPGGSSGTITIGHPTLTNHYVLMEKYVYAVDTVPEPDVTVSFVSYDTPGLVPVSIELCRFTTTFVNYTACTTHSGGYGYPAGFLGF